MSAYRVVSSSSVRHSRAQARAGPAPRSRGPEIAPEPLESRRMFAVTAAFAGGVLTVTGDNNANAITVSRNTAGQLRVNNGAVAIQGSTATVTNTTLIDVRGLGGNDNLVLSETSGALPKARIAGGDGNDVLTGGSGADALAGDAGNDLLFGKGGNDSLNGGVGNDAVTGGSGDDRAFGDAGNDRLIWNPGDGSDLNEGGEGTDLVEVNGAAVGEAFQALGVGSRVLFQRLDPAPFTIDIGGTENLVLNANGGNDSFFGGAGLAGVTAFTVNGGTGNDELFGTDGNDRLFGGDGNDFVDGNAGADLGDLGSGNDVFRWDGGDGSDVVEGRGGTDTMLFNGADIAENVDISANGGRSRFFRTQGNITMDNDDVEVLAFNARGGADNILIHDLRATDVGHVNLDLGTAAGAVDGATDNVTVEGGGGDDVFRVGGSAAGGVVLTGPAGAVNITRQEAGDKLTVNALAGDDIVTAAKLQANAIAFIASGGDGDDLLVGGAGNDTLLGGAGQDVVIGGPGTDEVDGGLDEDIVVP